MDARVKSALLTLPVLSLMSCATSSKSTSGSERQEAAPVTNVGSACGSRARIAAGQSEHTLESSGVRRRLLVHLPAGHEADAALPLVFNLHGSGGTPEGQLAESGLARVADAQGFVLVLPEGVGQRWNVPPDPTKPDDVRFMADALEHVDTLVCVDRQRVFATGFSGGARMSSQLACDLSARIAAVVAVGGVRFPGPCSGSRAFPLLAFHGTGDDVNPYDGGGQPYWQTGVEPAIEGWARHNACGARSEEAVADGVTRIGFAGCTEVALFRIAGFGHRWPGAISAEASANDLLWSFFERHPLP
jgi:polyhydroxybutyrate depolymerase